MSASLQRPSTIDIGPLSWVIEEVRASLANAVGAIKAFAANPNDTTQLRFARTHLHQAHGALQIVDLEGVPLITGEAERLLDQLEDGRPCDAATVALFERVFNGLMDYLDDLLGGSPHQPIRLFPHYRDLLVALKAERIHPADLLFPDMSAKVGDSDPIVPASHEALASARARFERGLLKFLRNLDRRAGLNEMAGAVRELRGSQPRGATRSFWTVIDGLLQSVASHTGDPDLNLKRLCARINLQMRRALEGSQALAERLLKDALFYVAVQDSPNPAATAVRDAYRLQGAVPVDYQATRYGRIDPQLINRAREALTSLKSIWDRLMGGQTAEAAAFQRQVSLFVDNVEALGEATLSEIASAFSDIAQRTVQTKAVPNADIGIETATAILFVENALATFNRLDAQFPDRAKLISQRLRAALAGQPLDESVDWLSELSRRSHERSTMSTVVGEIQTNLRAVEQALDNFFRDPSKREGLASSEALLNQTSGALLLLDEQSASAALEFGRTAIARFMQPGYAPDKREFERVAQTFGALGFFVDALRQPGNVARPTLEFDPHEGAYVTRMLSDSPAQAELHAFDAITDEDRSQPSIPAIVRTQPKVTPAPVDRAFLDKTQVMPILPSDEDQPFATSEDFTDMFDLAGGEAFTEDVPMLGEELGFELPVQEEGKSVEGETRERAMRAVELVERLSIDPFDDEALALLRTELAEVRQGAELLDDARLLAAARSAQSIVSGAELGPDALAALKSTLADFYADTPAKDAPAPDASTLALAASDDASIDAELLSIFLEEAREVLDAVEDARDKSIGNPANQEHLTTLRRAFHTLKGSSRMVGLRVFGEAGWALEQVLNQWLSEERSGNAALYALVGSAREQMGDWVERIEAGDHRSVRPEALIAAAERVRAGNDFFLGAETESEVDDIDFAAGSAAPSDSLDTDSSIVTADDHESLGDPEPDAMAYSGMVDVATLGHDNAANDEPTMPELDLGEVAGSPFEPVLEVEAFDATALEEEASLLFDSPEAEIAAFEAASREPVAYAPVEPQSFEPTLDDGSDFPQSLEVETIGPDGESVVEIITDVPTTTVPDVHSSEATEQRRIGDLVISNQLFTIFLNEADDRLSAVEEDFQLWRLDPTRPVSERAIRAMHSLSGASATAGVTPVHDLAVFLEQVLLGVERAPVVVELAEFDTLDYVTDRLRAMLLQFAAGLFPDPERGALSAVDELRTGWQLRQQLPLVAEDDDVAIPLDDEPFAAPIGSTFESPIDSAEPVVLPIESVAVAGGHGGPSVELDDAEANDPIAQIQDELDLELLELFVAEAGEYLPAIGAALNELVRDPARAGPLADLLRHLHTVKGSARMAGAMRLGALIHEMEGRLEAAEALDISLFEQLIARYDDASTLFEGLQRGESVDLPTFVAPTLVDETELPETLPDLADAGPGSNVVPLRSPAAPAFRAAPAGAVAVDDKRARSSSLVRVRSEVLERLVNQAGEVSIARSRRENDLLGVRGSLGELGENVLRLRAQLREIEIAAEAQVATRLEQQHKAGVDFDPLEFDRYTRLQELTRMMAESVADVSMIEQNIVRSLDGANKDITTQARLTRDMQQDLMRVRMVPFDSVSDRLYRVVRQAAKETGKRVNLELVGASVELDRGVLDRMAGPFEHLLRNSVVHGIESRQQRLESGKAEAGEIRVAIRQEGNEVVLEFADDGAGLDLGRIRAKAVERGLLPAPDAATDDEAAQLIFAPGFSTASEVTELAGRGVGMDVVRAEATSLGGRIEIETEAGRGSRFSIRLPLTLAVTQVVLVKAGDRVHALPSVLVEQVQQIKPNVLAAAYNEGKLAVLGEPVDFVYLPLLLGQREVVPMAQRYSPVVAIRSGGRRIALHVDEVIGNQEVVVKNVGPQLARMIGIAGATVLGSGDIVLILDPVQLMGRVDLRVEDAAARTGAVGEMVQGSTPSRTETALSTAPVVMVVDDSVTVRRVTQRMLIRDGYQVVMAKDGVDALEQIQEFAPDIMLVDIEMPRMDGFDLTRNVRSDVRTREIPIIMITSRTADKHRNMAMSLGVDLYLGKPYQEEELLRSVRGLLERRRQAVPS
ncbi:hypothetical protein BH10PSE17_BH10PSE17_34200 [soil metagenome]